MSLLALLNESKILLEGPRGLHFETSISKLRKEAPGFKEFEKAMKPLGKMKGKSGPASWRPIPDALGNLTIETGRTSVADEYIDVLYGDGVVALRVRPAIGMAQADLGVMPTEEAMKLGAKGIGKLWVQKVSAKEVMQDLLVALSSAHHFPGFGQGNILSGVKGSDSSASFTWPGYEGEMTLKKSGGGFQLKADFGTSESGQKYALSASTDGSDFAWPMAIEVTKLLTLMKKNGPSA